jgi:hypothetical protein
MNLVLVSALAPLLVLSASSSAAGFVRSRTTKGCNPVHWDQTCIHVTANPVGAGLSSTDVDRLAARAIESWGDATQGTAFLELVYAGTSDRDTAMDRRHVITFRSESWCRPAEEPGGEEICYDPAAVAITTLSYVSDSGDPSADGRILDADIELNAVANRFVDLDAADTASADGRKVVDLWNTLTHELGHLQGLEHTCRLGPADGIPQCTRDDRGAPLVDCKAVEQGRGSDPALQALFDASMYPRAEPREIRKREPKADDVAAIVAGYPLSSDPGICAAPGHVSAADDGRPATKAEAPPGAAGCSASGSQPARGGIVMAAMVALFAGMAGRRRPGQAQREQRSTD